MEGRAVARVSSEVVVSLGDEVPIGEVEQRGAEVDRAPDGIDRTLREPDDERRGRDDGCRGWDDSARAPGIEAAETDVAEPEVLLHQQRADEETGDDEEDVDTDETSGEVGDRGVEEDDQEYADRAEALDVRTEPEAGVGAGHPRSGSRGGRFGSGRPDECGHGVPQGMTLSKVPFASTATKRMTIVLEAISRREMRRRLGASRRI